MVTVQIQDSFIEQKLKTECKGNLNNFIDKIKNLFENEERDLAKAYERGELSTGEIAQKLGIHKEDVLELLNRYGVYYADYDLEEERKRLKKLRKVFNIKAKE